MLYELFDRITGRTLGTFDAKTPTKAKNGFAANEGFDSVRQLEIARDVILSCRKYPH
jgi:hypothetical protein